ncbi:hypothetical protein QOZ80_3AG0226720 [Eleusine coracana subsp. coracana]|nr:hypothetical protein QOZ80_3AG0226720 [Eleusine coracana subsp. coracana]
MAAYAMGVPSGHDLITLVLRPLVAGQQRLDGGGFVHLADVYSVPPERLAERYAPLPGTDDDDWTWYFVCPACCRNKAAGAPGGGSWSAGTAAEVIRGAEGRRVGSSRTLAYGSKTTAPWAAVTRRGWCMVELALDENGGGGRESDLVLCKMFRSPSCEASRAAASTAAMTAFLLERKAVHQHPEAPPTVRQHG